MSKFPQVLALTVVASLLTGCAGTTEPAAEQPTGSAGPSMPTVPAETTSPEQPPAATSADDPSPSQEPSTAAAEQPDQEPAYPTPANEETPGISIQPGEDFIIGGEGYAPGEEIIILFAKQQTDYNYIDHPIIYAGPTGAYKYNVRVPEDLAPGEYGIMTATPRVADIEASKRFLDVLVATP